MIWTTFLPLSAAGGAAALLLCLARPALRRFAKIQWNVPVLTAALCLFVLPLPAFALPGAWNAPAQAVQSSVGAVLPAETAASEPLSVATELPTAADKLLAEAVKTAIDAAFPDGKAVGLRDMHGEDCYTVLYRTTVPSVLIEIGFISNAGDAARLTDATFRTTFADAVCNAIDAYFGAPAEE